MTAGKGGLAAPGVRPADLRGWRRVALIVGTFLVGLPVGQLAIGGVLLSGYGFIHGLVTDPSPILVIWLLVALASVAPVISAYLTWRRSRTRHASLARTWTLSLCVALGVYLLAVCVVLSLAFALPL